MGRLKFLEIIIFRILIQKSSIRNTVVVIWKYKKNLATNLYATSEYLTGFYEIRKTSILWINRLWQRNAGTDYFYYNWNQVNVKNNAKNVSITLIKMLFIWMNRNIHQNKNCEMHTNTDLNWPIQFQFQFHLCFSLFNISSFIYFGKCLWIFCWSFSMLNCQKYLFPPSLGRNIVFQFNRFHLKANFIRSNKSMVQFVFGSMPIFQTRCLRAKKMWWFSNQSIFMYNIGRCLWNESDVFRL